MSNHTPGPWSVDCEVEDLLTDSARAWINADGMHIGYVDGPIREERRANARLIAAAPDLLHAIDLCLDAMLHDGVPTDPEHPARVALTIARNAYFQATGEKI